MVQEHQLLCCPICQTGFTRDSSIAMPFCSPRCRQIDLGRWLTESYGMPVENADQPEPEVDFSDFDSDT